ncbi:hypothetical protein LTR84_011442 [Exophiala bonariae]|uniref:Uncharacterized protein n=1 Tax=Exophiala bonariae TaxID=1690606 RepID=A0AAV9MRR1_9EURO|nr:hypothetical protein LTR84_011442 [Exophiala bonariae]
MLCTLFDPTTNNENRLIVSAGDLQTSLREKRSELDDRAWGLIAQVTKVREAMEQYEAGTSKLSVSKHPGSMTAVRPSRGIDKSSHGAYQNHVVQGLVIAPVYLGQERSLMLAVPNLLSDRSQPESSGYMDEFPGQYGAVSHVAGQPSQH